MEEEDERMDMDKAMHEKEKGKGMGKGKGKGKGMNKWKGMGKGKIPYRPFLSKPSLPFPSKATHSLLSPADLKTFHDSLRETMTKEGE